ncbi:MAG: hypothetical protein ABI156_09600 [Caldimonas sp.]
MNDIIELDPRQQSLKTLGHISYLLHTVVAIGAVLPGVQASVAILLLAFALDMYKKGEAVGSWQESHFRWRIRSVLWAGGLYLVTAPLWVLLLVPGWIAWALISIWFLYRIVRGWINLSNNVPMPT